MGKVMILVALLLGGCTATSGGQFCQIAKKSWMQPTPHDVDVISDRLAKGLLTGLETGRELCGWTP